MAAKSSAVAGQLVRALALRMKMRGVSPLTPLHVEGKRNAMTDIPSRSFGTVKQWHCKTDAQLKSLFDRSFPLPNQRSWTVFRPSSRVFTKVLSVLWIQPITMAEWRRLPAPGRFIGEIGPSSALLWKWTLFYRDARIGQRYEASQDSHNSA